MGIHVLQGFDHALGTGVSRVEDDEAVLAVDTDGEHVRHVTHGRVDSVLDQPSLLVNARRAGFLQDVLCRVRIQAHSLELGDQLLLVLDRIRVDGHPELRVGSLQSHAVQSTTHAGFLRPDDRHLTLEGNVVQDIHNRLQRAGSRTGEVTLDGKAFTHAKARVHKVQLVGITLERDIVLEHFTPGVDALLGFKPVGHQHVLGSFDKLVDVLGQLFVLGFLFLAQAVEISNCIIRGDARASVRHARVTGRDQVVVFLGVAVLQVELKLVNLDVHFGHLLDERTELTLEEVHGLLGNTTVVQRLFQVGIKAVSDIANPFDHGLHNTFGINVLVLPAVCPVVHLGLLRRIPHRQRSRLALVVATGVLIQVEHAHHAGFDVVIQGCFGKALTLRRHDVVEDALHNVLVVKTEHVLQTFEQALSGQDKLVPGGAQLARHQLLSIDSPVLRRVDVLVVIVARHQAHGIVICLDRRVLKELKDRLEVSTGLGRLLFLDRFTQLICPIHDQVCRSISSHHLLKAVGDLVADGHRILDAVGSLI